MAGLIGVVDANVLIAFLDGDDALHERAVSLLEEHAAADLVIGELTLAEALVGPLVAGSQRAVLTAVRELGIAVVSLGEPERFSPTDVALGLAGLRAETGLKMHDCCVLLTARQRGAQVLTFDEELARAAAP